MLAHVFVVGVGAAVPRVASVIQAEDFSAGIAREGQEICRVVQERRHTEGER